MTLDGSFDVSTNENILKGHIDDHQMANFQSMVNLLSLVDDLKTHLKQVNLQGLAD